MPFRIHWPSVLVTALVLYFVLPWILGKVGSSKKASA
jgi:hypothetical protein